MKQSGKYLLIWEGLVIELVRELPDDWNTSWEEGVLQELIDLEDLLILKNDEDGDQIWINMVEGETF